jgi:[histone H3]-dimethyl-L-lysine9 demethylase
MRTIFSGPKMYNAQATHLGDGSHGTTRLHMDIADAVNIMAHACCTPSGGPGYATWDIFRAEDADALRSFLRAQFKVPSDVDPIHRQRYYLHTGLLNMLAATHGVRSHRIYQVPGQAVFIPAGCAHQVRIPTTFQSS